MPRILVLDNYDSFTYNLVQYLEMLGARCTVVYSDAIDVPGVRAFWAGAPAGSAESGGGEGIVISPGPCTPNEAGASLSIISELGGDRPILGVCLGHQAIGQAFGGNVVRADRIMHGKTSPIEHDGRTLFSGLSHPFTATRYHSLIVERASLPPSLEISAWTAEGEIMGLRHKEKAIEGVQFHPESILTTSGMAILANWVRSLAPGAAHA